MEYESKLIPILRDGVSIVKMIIFRKTTLYFQEQYPDREKDFANRLAGAVINEIFGTPNPEPAFVEFTQVNTEAIEAAVGKFAADFEELRIPITDALRVAVLCDHQEGVDNSAVLARAQTAGILIADRDLPLPHRFIELVRRLGAAYGLVTPPVAES